MKSHGSPEQALAHGVPEEALAMREQIKRPRRKRSGWPPPAALCQQRAHHAALHMQACRLIAGVQDMHMFHVRSMPANKKPDGKPAFPRKQKRTRPPALERDAKRRYTGPRIAQKAWDVGTAAGEEDSELLVYDFVHHQAASLPSEGDLLSMMWSSPGDGRDGLHTLAVAHGPTGPPGTGERPNGTMDVMLACTTCDARASNTGRWAALTKSQCGPARPSWNWSKHPHAYMPDVHGRTCIHCGLRIPGDRGTHARVGACPCDCLMDGAEEIIEGTILLRGVLGLRACWLAWARGPKDRQTESPPPIPNDPVVAPSFLGSYREHVQCTLLACAFCLRCGQLPKQTRDGFTLARDGACRAQLGIIPARVAVAIASLAPGQSAYLADGPHAGFWQALIAHCSATATALGADATNLGYWPAVRTNRAPAVGLGTDSTQAPGSAGLNGSNWNRHTPGEGPCGSWVPSQYGASVGRAASTHSGARSRTPRGVGTRCPVLASAAPCPVRAAAQARLVAAFACGAVEASQLSGDGLAHCAPAAALLGHGPSRHGVSAMACPAADAGLSVRLGHGGDGTAVSIPFAPPSSCASGRGAHVSTLSDCTGAGGGRCI